MYAPEVMHNTNISSENLMPVLYKIFAKHYFCKQQTIKKCFIVTSKKFF